MEYDEDEFEEIAKNYNENEIEHDPVGFMEERGFISKSSGYNGRNYWEWHGNNSDQERLFKTDEFIEGLKDADGRGHGMNSYDGIEHEFTYNGIDYYIYQIG